MDSDSDKCINSMEIAFRNLLLLSNKTKTKEDFENIIIDGCELKIMEPTDNFNAIFSLQELEYPVLLTFERILFFIEYSNKCKYQNYTKQELMYLCDNVIDILLYYFDICNEDNKIEHIFSSLLDDIIEKYNLVDDKRDTTYFRVYEKCSLMLDIVSETLLESGKYLYHTKPHQLYISDDDEEDEEIEEIEEEIEEIEEENKEEGKEEGEEEGEECEEEGEVEEEEKEEKEESEIKESKVKEEKYD